MARRVFGNRMEITDHPYALVTYDLGTFIPHIVDSYSEEEISDPGQSKYRDLQEWLSSIDPSTEEYD